MNEEKTALPFNNLEDKSGIEKKIEEIEKENETALKRATEGAKKVKEGTGKTIINNIHHFAATLSISMFAMANKSFEQNDYVGTAYYSAVGAIAYVAQNFLHTLKLSSPVNLSDWGKMLGEKTGMVRRKG